MAFHQKTHKTVQYLIAFIWLVNGLYCKLLHMTPRHELIVVHILGPNFGPQLTMLIGIAEILMAIWIFSGIYQKQNAILQIIIILTMNVLEFILVPDLLLWGKFNLVFAILFSSMIYYHAFSPAKNQALNV